MAPSAKHIPQPPLVAVATIPSLPGFSPGPTGVSMQGSSLLLWTPPLPRPLHSGQPDTSITRNQTALPFCSKTSTGSPPPFRRSPPTWYVTSVTSSCSFLPLAHSVPPTLGPLSLLNTLKLVCAPGPLHFLFPVPRTLSSRISAQRAPPSLQGKCHPLREAFSEPSPDSLAPSSCPSSNTTEFSTKA